MRYHSRGRYRSHRGRGSFRRGRRPIRRGRSRRGSRYLRIGYRM